MGGPARPSSAIVGVGKGEELPTPPHPTPPHPQPCSLPPVVEGKPGPEGLRAQSRPCSIVDSTPLVESGEVEGGMRAGPEGLREGGGAGPTTGLSRSGEGEMPHPSPPVAVGELPLPLTSSSA